MTAVGKEDKCLLSGLVIRVAFCLHSVHDALHLFLTAHVSVLSDVLIFYSKASEALDELFAIVAESFEVLETLEVVKSAERRVVLICKEHCDHFRRNEGHAG